MRLLPPKPRNSPCFLRSHWRILVRVVCRRPRRRVMHWTQIYDPFGRWWLSTLVAALPILVLFGLLAGLKVKPHLCAIAGASTAASVAVVVFKMQLTPPATCFGDGGAFFVVKMVLP